MIVAAVSGQKAVAASPTICWFRLDLRLDDHPALRAAAAHGGPVIPVFIWDPEEEAPWQPGAASRWWLHYSLAALDAQLRPCGSRLILRRGPSAEALSALAKETGATAVFYNRRCEPAVIQRDAELDRVLRSAGIEVHAFDTALLFDPSAVLTNLGEPFLVFALFWKACLKLAEPPEPLSVPARLSSPQVWPASMALSELALATAIDRDDERLADWQPGAAAAHTTLERFARTAVNQYPVSRDNLEPAATSRLSPHLHFGEISPRQVWHTVKHMAGWQVGGILIPAAEAFLRQLAWREFAYHLLCHFPQTTTQPLRGEFSAFPWDPDPKKLNAWQSGQTGYPIVDAAMRQLSTSGWILNRARMVVASFLAKDLLTPWLEGARWFWETLVDADLANNTLGWQWTAGCGADAAPFFRIFNPVLQGRRFDPQGRYVRRWVPELARLPATWVHRPWDAPHDVLTATGVELGRTYPLPIIDHAAARRRALEAFKSIRGTAQDDSATTP